MYLNSFDLVHRCRHQLETARSTGHSQRTRIRQVNRTQMDCTRPRDVFQVDAQPSVRETGQFCHHGADHQATCYRESTTRHYLRFELIFDE